MRAEFERKGLQSAFAAASGAVPSRSPKAVLQSVKIVAADDGAALTATDLEVGVLAEIAGAVAREPGACLVPADKLGAILRSATADAVEVDATGDVVTVVCGRSRFNLPKGDPAEFPDVAPFDGAGAIEVPADALRTLVRRTSFACDPASARFALGGCLAEWDASSLSLVGTDGRRLAHATAPASAPAGPDGTQHVVPQKAMRLVERACNGGAARLAFDRSGVALGLDGLTIRSRLVEGRFPAWRGVFPDGKAAMSATTAGALRAAVEQAAIATSDERRGVDFAFDDGLLKLSASVADVGGSAVEMEARHEGPPVAVTMDFRYLLDALKALGDEAEIAIDLVDAKSGVVLRADGYAYVVMPMTRDR
jgi:DNA polymerase-3 subunit beta